MVKVKTTQNMKQNKYKTNISKNKKNQLESDEFSGENVKNDSLYEIEKIVDKRTIDNKIEYKVKWKNYPSSQNSWEPIEHFVSAQSIITDYETKCLSKPNKQNKGEHDEFADKNIKQVLRSLVIDDEQYYEILFEDNEHNDFLMLSQMKDFFPIELESFLQFQSESQKQNKDINDSKKIEIEDKIDDLEKSKSLQPKENVTESTDQFKIIQELEEKQNIKDIDQENIQSLDKKLEITEQKNLQNNSEINIENGEQEPPSLNENIKAFDYKVDNQMMVNESELITNQNFELKNKQQKYLDVTNLEDNFAEIVKDQPQQQQLQYESDYKSDWAIQNDSNSQGDGGENDIYKSYINEIQINSDKKQKKQKNNKVPIDELGQIQPQVKKQKINKTIQQDLLFSHEVFQKSLSNFETSIKNVCNNKQKQSNFNNSNIQQIMNNSSLQLSQAPSANSNKQQPQQLQKQLLNHKNQFNGSQVPPKKKKINRDINNFQKYSNSQNVLEIQKKNDYLQKFDDGCVTKGDVIKKVEYMHAYNVKKMDFMFRVHWKKRENGQTPGQSYLSYKNLKLFAPLFAIDFWEEEFKKQQVPFVEK